ncbi:MAG: hypothetical protein AAGN82_10355 [Myxococcota bacterium]
MSDLDHHLAAIAAGDADAFAHWLAGAEPQVRASLARFAGVVDTESVVQESLLTAWQVAPRITPDGHPNGLLRFCLRAARNRAISELRKQGRQAPSPDADAPVEMAPPDPLLRRAIAFCIEHLRGKPAAVLRARLADPAGGADVDLAGSLGMSRNTFAQNLNRARKQLTTCLTRRGVHLEASP